VADGAVEIFRELLVLKGVHQLFSLLLIICCLETVGREVPIQVGSPEGGVSPRVFLNLRRTQKYRELAHKPFSFHCNAGNYKNRRISLWHKPLGSFSWGRYLKIHTEIKTESFQQKKCVGRPKLTLSVTLIRMTCLQMTST
jgi:hypothetical protein